ncbi:hypothetical protein, partial [Pandoraea iniqua]|uniref:hypothetical protein n=1 Tax=Pandoraea iniqua TaxID=2508288 RepID=UPI001C2CE0CD
RNAGKLTDHRQKRLTRHFPVPLSGTSDFFSPWSCKQKVVRSQQESRSIQSRGFFVFGVRRNPIRHGGVPA